MELSSKPTEVVTPEKEAFRKILKMIETVKPMMSGVSSGENKMQVLALIPKLFKEIKTNKALQEVFSEDFFNKIKQFAE